MASAAERLRFNGMGLVLDGGSTLYLSREEVILRMFYCEVDSILLFYFIFLYDTLQKPWFY